MNIKQSAIKYLELKLSVIPTYPSKVAGIKWEPYQHKRMLMEEVSSFFSGFNNLAIICGEVSGGLEVIDVDTKNDPTGTLWSELSQKIQQHNLELFNRLVIGQTQSGGYHLYYRCENIETSLKLARHKSTEILIETRGEGAYVLAYPSPCYTFIQSDVESIPTITEKERADLFKISRSFNQIEEEKPKIVPSSTIQYFREGLNPFEDFNERGDIIPYLEKQGWKVVSVQGQKINLLRAGKTKTSTSGNYHTGKKVLKIFSQSAGFDVNRGYSNSQVFLKLECNGDNSLMYRRLLEMGYGEPYKQRLDNVTTITKSSYIALEHLIQFNTNPIQLNRLVGCLEYLVGTDLANEIVDTYHITTTQTGETMYWSIDEFNNIHRCKSQLYVDVDIYTDSNESVNYHQSECFFGQHLLTNSSMPIAVTNQEQTCVICSALLNDYVWISSGGNLSSTKCNLLKGRDVTLFPDKESYDDWKTIADTYKWKLSEQTEFGNIAEYLTGRLFLDNK